MSIYERLGGGIGVKAAVAVFYQRVLADELLAPYFDGVDTQRLKAHQRAFLAAAFGGPELFAGRDLPSAHAGMDITNEAYDALLEHLVATVRDLGAEDDLLVELREHIERFRAAVVTPALRS